MLSIPLCPDSPPGLAPLLKGAAGETGWGDSPCRARNPTTADVGPLPLTREANKAGFRSNQPDKKLPSP